MGVIFRDFRKAFDPVNKDVLRYKPVSSGLLWEPFAVAN